jgi:hypothetical protein
MLLGRSKAPQLLGRDGESIFFVAGFGCLWNRGER